MGEKGIRSFKVTIGYTFNTSLGVLRRKIRLNISRRFFNAKGTRTKSKVVKKEQLRTTFAGV